MTPMLYLTGLALAAFLLVLILVLFSSQIKFLFYKYCLYRFKRPSHIANSKSTDSIVVKGGSPKVTVLGTVDPMTERTSTNTPQETPQDTCMTKTLTDKALVRFLPSETCPEYSVLQNIPSIVVVSVV